MSINNNVDIRSSSSVSDTSVRDNHFYDPVHESRERHQTNSILPGHIIQITSNWTRLPSLVNHQDPSDHENQDLLDPLNQLQEDSAGPFTATRNFSNDFRSNSTSYNNSHYITEIYNYEGADEAESLIFEDPQAFEQIDPAANTPSNFMSPMFLSNPELASINTHQTQRTSIIAQRNLILLPFRPQVRPVLGNFVSSEQALNINISSETEPSSLPDNSTLRYRRRNNHNYSQTANIHNPNNANILRREYEVAFGNTGTNGLSSLDFREAANQRAVYEKRIPIRTVIAALETVKLEELEKADCTCIICYNEFGIANPEGITELPLRLPKCKHIFGEKCIKKWLEDSDSCPYCRDKLPSEKTYKKSCGHEADRLARERLAALRQRIAHAQSLSNYFSTVELTNARISQTMM